MVASAGAVVWMMGGEQGARGDGVADGGAVPHRMLGQQVRILPGAPAFLQFKSLFVWLMSGSCRPRAILIPGRL